MFRFNTPRVNPTNDQFLCHLGSTRKVRYQTRLVRENAEKHSTGMCHVYCTVKIVRGSWHSPDMSPTMVHDQDFHIITWPPPSKSRPHIRHLEEHVQNSSVSLIPENIHKFLVKTIMNRHLLYNMWWYSQIFVYVMNTEYTQVWEYVEREFW